MKKTASAPAAAPFPYPQTPNSALEYARAHGINISELARNFQLDRHVLVDLLRGKRKGLRGQAHRGAVLLGLKPDPQALDARRAA